MTFHRNVYDLLDLLPEVSSEAVEMIAAHEREHGQIPAAVREWYSVMGLVPLAEEARFDSAIWYQYSNMDPPESLSAVLQAIALAHDAAAPRRVMVMGECQNVGDWQVELDGSDDPPVWNYDPSHRDPGEEYWLAAPSFSQWVWNWIAQFHQFYKQFDPLAGQPHLGHWAAGTLHNPDADLAARLAERLGDPEAREVGFGDRRLTYRDGAGEIRLTANAAAPGPVAVWVHSADRAGYDQLLQHLAAVGVACQEFRTSDQDYDEARNGEFPVDLLGSSG